MSGPQLSREELENSIRREFEDEGRQGDLSPQQWQEVLAKTRKQKQRKRWHLFCVPLLPAVSRPLAAAAAVAASFVLFVTLTATSFLVSGVGGLACPAQPTEAYVEQADTILVGTIRSTNRPPWTWFAGPKAEVEVERYLKGSGHEVVTVRAGGLLSRATGWPEQRIDQRGVLFLTGEGSNLRDEPCSGTRWTFAPAPEQLERFLEEVEEVTGPGSAPQPGAGADNGFPAVGLTVSVLTILALGTTIYVVKQRRARPDGSEGGKGI